MNMVNATSPAEQLLACLGRQPRYEDFLIGTTLGEGSFSTVYEATVSNGSIHVALKVCDKRRLAREGKLEYAEREQRTMVLLEDNQSATTPFFVRLLASFQDTDSHFFVLSLASNGDLETYLDHLGPLPVASIRFYGAELTKALEHLRSLAVVHRDVKPGNILLDENWHIKLSDFGTAKLLDAEQMKPPKPEDDDWVNADAGSSSDEEEPTPRGPRRWSFVGSAPYISPEVLRGRPVSACSDLWALGVSLFQMATAKAPFLEDSDYWTFKKILGLEYAFPEKFDPELKEVVGKLLVLRPGQRLGARDEGPVYASLRASGFFRSLDFDEVYRYSPPPLENRQETSDI